MRGWLSRKQNLLDVRVGRRVRRSVYCSEYEDDKKNNSNTQSDGVYCSEYEDDKKNNSKTQPLHLNPETCS